MYIEIICNQVGDILGCWCANTLPEKSKSPLMTVNEMTDSKGVMVKGLPPEYMQARVNIDTLTAMEIEANCGQIAVINPDTGQPEIKTVAHSEYIFANYKVDLSKEIPATNLIPEGMKMFTLVKK